MANVHRPQTPNDVDVKIAFIVNNYPPRMGGVEIHVSSLAKELVARGNEVVVFTLASRPDEVVVGGVEVVFLREYLRVGGVLGFPKILTKRHLRKQLRSRDIQVISTHTRFFPLSYLGTRLGRSLGIPVIHTEHGSDFVTSPSWLIRAASKLVDFTMGRYVLRKATKVLGVSQEVVDFVRRLSGAHADLFFNAVHLPTKQPEPNALSNRLVFVGRIVTGKGWQLALDVAQRIHASHAVPDFEAVFLGDGNEVTHLQELVSTIDNNGWLKVLGRVSSQEVSVWLHGSVLVNPTTLSEGFQTTLLEALANGASIVTYPVPGAELLASEGAPVSIVRTEGISEWVNTVGGELHSRSRPVSRHFLESWAWPRRAAQYEVICRDVLTDFIRLK